MIGPLYLPLPAARIARQEDGRICHKARVRQNLRTQFDFFDWLTDYWTIELINSDNHMLRNLYTLVDDFTSM